MPTKTKPKKKTLKKRAPKAVSKGKVIDKQENLVRRPASAESITNKQRLVKLPSVYQLSLQVWDVLWTHKKILAGLAAIYGLLNLVLVQGLSTSTDITTLKKEFDHVFTGNAGALVSGLSIFAVLVSSSGNSSSQTAGAYQTILTIITSLAVIWALRQLMMGKQISVKDTFYKGMSPFIPFILVLLVIILQLLPLIIGTSLYALVSSNGIAVGIVEKLAFGIVSLTLASWSVYMLSSSIFAVYIVTLPNMTPKSALKSAKDLVKNRRWSVIRKILALPVILLVVSAIIMIPIILLLTSLAQWFFFILTMFGLIVLHTYIYTLYRDLLA
ncbi:MAG TPA: hypothetical protein VFN51_00055 [Candidatus Saccharimonadales bacterium]|nr:hypothetical protein [Candidatus Saccharimonadales bacterium]